MAAAAGAGDASLARGMSGRSRTDTDFSVTDETSLLFASCKRGDVATVGHVLRSGSAGARAVRKGTTPLHVATRAGAKECVEALIKADPGCCALVDAAGFTAFARAAEAGRLDIMRILHAARPEAVFDRDLAMFTPLHRAAAGNHVEAAQFLLSNGADVNAVDSKLRHTPLFHACRHGALDTATLLIDRGADVNAFDADYSSCVFEAIQGMPDNIGECTQVLALLIERGAKLDIQNNFNSTPLSFSLDLECTTAVKMLLRGGANPHFAPYNRRSPLDEVLIKNNQTMVKAFRRGLGDDLVKKRLFELSGKCDAAFLVGKHMTVEGYGRGFCVEYFRPYIGLFGPIHHTIRFEETGEEKSLILKRDCTSDGVPFYLEPDQNFEAPLLIGLGPYSQ